MTRKHYIAVARIIKDAQQKIVNPTMKDVAAEEMRVHIARELAEYFRVEGGLDINGNRRFKTERFLDACEVSK